MRCIHMGRHTLKFKLSVVEYFLSGQGGQKATAKKFEIDHSTVRKWVAAYQQHGIAGVESKQWKSHSAEFKESVILHMRQHNLSARTTGAYFNIPIPPIRQWEKLYDEGGLQALTPRKRGRPFGMKSTIIKPSSTQKESSTLSPEEMQRELEYLRAENACLKKLHALIQEKEKLAVKKKQR